MTQRYKSGMIIVAHNGKPNIFFLMICNPSCSKISLELQNLPTTQDCLDLSRKN